MNNPNSNGGCIIQVWFEGETERERGRFYTIETELPDFATVCEMIEADRFIGGAVLLTRKARGNLSAITYRRPTAFRGSAVRRLQLPDWRFVEDAEA